MIWKNWRNTLCWKYFSFWSCVFPLYCNYTTWLCNCHYTVLCGYRPCGGTDCRPYIETTDYIITFSFYSVLTVHYLLSEGWSRHSSHFLTAKPTNQQQSKQTNIKRQIQDHFETVNKYFAFKCLFMSQNFKQTCNWTTSKKKKSFWNVI